jgi:hypothetical protein
MEITQQLLVAENVMGRMFVAARVGREILAAIVPRLEGRRWRSANVLSIATKTMDGR